MIDLHGTVVGGHEALPPARQCRVASTPSCANSKGEPKLKLYLLAFSILFLQGLSCAGASQAKQVPFTPGEKLIYELRWEFVPAGQAILEVLPTSTVDGVKAYHFKATAISNAFVDKFYKVRDYIDAYANAEMSHSVLYLKKQLEGKRKREVRVVFDWNTMQAQYSNFGKARQPIPLLPGTFDPLSIFYSFRFRHLRENTELEAPVSAGKRCVIGKVRILTKQRITVRGGTFDTFLVEPDLKDVRGIFEKSKNAKLQIWVTSDYRRIPVKIKTKVVIGSIIGELAAIEQN